MDALSCYIRPPFVTPANNPFPYNPGFDVGAVLALAKSLPSHSWEYGTAAEALLELFDPELSVYGSKPFPIPTISPQDSPALAYAQQKIVIGTPPNGLSSGDGAAADPASLGVSAVLLGKTRPTYAQAAKAEAGYLVGTVPRWSNGAISHRAAYAELWADFIYMVPPFLGYYGVATNNVSFLQEAVNQCLLYREVLQAKTVASSARPPSTHPLVASGLWTHIRGPVNNDPGIWSTGNAWAAAGMMRVLATLVKAPSPLFEVGRYGTVSMTWKIHATTNLVNAIREILDASMRVSTDGGLLRNYLDDPSWFGETSGSALLASVAYRLATLSTASSLQKYIQWAEQIRKTLGCDGHISRGIATPAVNPLGWGDRKEYTQGSPEGQNFVILMYAAWRDCVKAQVKGCKAVYW
ncbi:hypothetical protein M413DRAFT_18686 [Hebeloma cylindrosporum]|uniref:Glycoside hydrolase family 105 protein n=1 Tax=Hebeloma cylindrosporum TaxID=76867 RepID=A0A0C3C0Q7_HEBCY|nr:hypothetical protein M413DRAFT_18686 [Hebeloma cylindrosporum h7]